MMSKWLFGLALCAVLTVRSDPAAAQTPDESAFRAEPELTCDPYAAPTPAPILEESPEQDALLQRLLKYTDLSVRHRLKGLASYYSGFFDGRKTANGEIFRNGRHTAAHLTLPLGSWVEITARATGKKLRLRVNDRGPYVKKFTIDLSQAAARFLGVDRAHDRYVEVRIIALPGEEPLPADVDWTLVEGFQKPETAAAVR